ncbi:MAG: DUF2283 domain-containing protein [Nanoarchaeota archaeon]
MEGTYDERHDTAYIYLSPRSEDRKVARTEPQKDNILYDYDRNGRIIGIEFLNASSTLHPSLLEELSK